MHQRMPHAACRGTRRRRSWQTGMPTHGRCTAQQAAPRRPRLVNHALRGRQQRRAQADKLVDAGAVKVQHEQPAGWGVVGLKGAPSRTSRFNFNCSARLRRRQPMAGLQPDASLLRGSHSTPSCTAQGVPPRGCACRKAHLPSHPPALCASSVMGAPSVARFAASVACATRCRYQSTAHQGGVPKKADTCSSEPPHAQTTGCMWARRVKQPGTGTHADRCHVSARAPPLTDSCRSELASTWRPGV